MTKQKLVSRWPDEFDPDNPAVFAEAGVIREVEKDLSTESAMHVHPTGQLTVAVSGVCSVQFEDAEVLVPCDCALYIPPGILHTARMTEKSSWLSFHAGKCYLDQLPSENTLLLLNRMTIELVTFFSNRRKFKRTQKELTNIADVIIAEVKRADTLPYAFAPLPAHPVLRKIVEEIQLSERVHRSNKEWADFSCMCEKTLNRLTVAQTGMTFRQWCSSHILFRALSLIRQHKNIDEVAYLSGYRESSSFIAAFKKAFGTTPHQMKSK